MLIKNGEEFAGPRRNREAKIAAHELARKQARVALDAYKALTAERVGFESTLGFLKGDLAEAQKRVARCRPPERNTYPTPEPISRWEVARAEQVAEVMRLEGQIAAVTRDHDRALQCGVGRRKHFRKSTASRGASLERSLRLRDPTQGHDPCLHLVCAIAGRLSNHASTGPDCTPGARCQVARSWPGFREEPVLREGNSQFPP